MTPHRSECFEGRRPLWESQLTVRGKSLSPRLRQLRVEALEDRCLLSADPWPASQENVDSRVH